MNAEDGCYLFKYKCNCYGNSCFAIVDAYYGLDDEFRSIKGTVYDNYHSFREFQYTTNDGFTFDGCWEEIGTSSGGGAGLSMPRIRLANWEHRIIPKFDAEQNEFIEGQISFSVNVQDGTVQEGDELQVCAMRRTFDKQKLRPILSRTITAEDIENLAKQPYLQITSYDYSGNNLGRDDFSTLKSFRRTDSVNESHAKPKYIRIRRPIYKEGLDKPVNAYFSNVVPVNMRIKYEVI
jgi:hypothetical protein